MNPDDKSLILVADDNPQNLQVLGIMLKENGYKTALAQNGSQVLEFLKKKLPDMILLDMMMPEMDGFETCRRLKADEKTRDIPVIFITAMTDSLSKIKAFELGGVDYVTKPFMKEELLARINVHLQLRKAIQRLENMSISDEMTGIYNRRFAYHILTRQINIAHRDKKKFVLCYIDIDNLKKVNDTFGHKEGDLLIKTVVEALNKAIRSTDYFFRMGGDEFLIVFPEISLTEADNLIARLQESLNKKNIKDVPIDFSFGFSEFRFDDECFLNEECSVDELIKRADAIMYKEKKDKKAQNQVV